MQSHDGRYGSTVLVVEDEPRMLRLLEIMLTAENISVLLAANGEEALDLYRNHKCDISVILLDLRLPKISGYDVLETVKREDPDVCVVIASGYVDENVKSRMQQSGVKHFIDKPYNFGRSLKRQKKPSWFAPGWAPNSFSGSRRGSLKAEIEIRPDEMMV